MSTESGRNAGRILLSAILAVLVVLVALQGFYIYKLHWVIYGSQAVSGQMRHSALKQGNDLEDSVNAPWFSTDAKRWEPFKNMERIRSRIDGLFGDEIKRLHAETRMVHPGIDLTQTPKMNLTEKKDSFVVDLHVPGVTKENVSVDIDGQRLTVRGKASDYMKKDDADHGIVEELQSGQFERVITLPAPVESEQMSAVCKDGVLTITVPKAKQMTAGRKVPVR